MDHFEYITMVVSFVTAFAISQVLAGWARQWTYRTVQPAFPLHTVSSVLFLVTLVQSIWGSWAYRDVPWTFGTFFLYFVTMLPLAGAATLLHPPANAAATTPLDEHYFSNGRAAYLLIAVWIVLAGWLEWALVDHLGAFSETSGLLLAVRIVGAALLLTLAWSRNPRIHWTGLAALVGLLTISVLRFGQFGDAA